VLGGAAAPHRIAGPALLAPTKLGTIRMNLPHRIAAAALAARRGRRIGHGHLATARATSNPKLLTRAATPTLSHVEGKS
jgi:hypothetical protein